MISALRYAARHPQRTIGALLNDPFSLWDTMVDRLVQSREYKRPPYAPETEPDWEEHLANWLDDASPIPNKEFEELWPQVIADMEARHIPTGPLSFNGFNDGDKGFVRAVWRIVRGLQPDHVVETGVAHGMTSRFILEAIARNEMGRLWSIDRPPLDPAMHAQVGAAVGHPRPFRWSLIEGTSRRRLPALLSSIDEIDIFVHDSLHTERNVRFELELAWDHLRPGGAMIVDDIDSNWGFNAFIKSHRGLQAMVCQAEPIRPDPRRFNSKGLFGIVLKDR